MKIPVNEIRVRLGRRDAAPEAVKTLAGSMAESGLMNPITVDAGHNLIAGRHRLEAAKILGWAEIECFILAVDGLHAELAEIDENLIRTNCSDLELAELLARRKKIYEALHPTTIARNLPGHASNYKSSGDKLTGEEKPFSRDTAEKMGVSPRTVERHIQIAENLSSEAKEILCGVDTKITKQNLTKLSRLESEQQTEAAKRLAEGTIRSVDEYMAGGAVTRGKDYYCTGVFIVDAFSEHNHTLGRIPELHRLCLDKYREKLSPAQIKELICIARSSVAMLQSHIAFLESELEVLE